MWLVQQQLQGALEGCALELSSLQLLLVLKLGFLSEGKTKPWVDPLLPPRTRHCSHPASSGLPFPLSSWEACGQALCIGTFQFRPVVSLHLSLLVSTQCPSGKEVTS